MNKELNMHLVSTGYPPKQVYIIWTVPHNSITDYEVYRNGVLIASTAMGSKFESPTIFDSDHHTNLFRKMSIHKLMFIDEDVQAYQHYTYKVVAKRVIEGFTFEEIPSNDGVIEAL